MIVRGTGRMRVGDERRDVAPGDLVLAPGGVTHGIENTGPDTLQCVSVATLACRVTDIHDRDS